MAKPPSSVARSSRRGRWRVALFLGVVVVLFLSSFLLPTSRWLAHLRDWIEGQGAWGAVLFVVVYIGCTILLVPGLILTLAAGALYGPYLGTFLVWVGANTGAAAAFLITRYLAREQVRGWIERNPRFAAVDTAIGRQGGWIVLLLRLSPAFPFNLLNYALGLTGIHLVSSTLASLVGMLPGVIAYVLVGYAGQQFLSGGPKVLFWTIAAAATLLVTIVITRLATRAIRQAGRLPERG